MNLLAVTGGFLLLSDCVLLLSPALKTFLPTIKNIVQME